MCKILVKWLKTAGVDQSEIDASTETILQHMVVDSFDVSKAAKIPPENVPHLLDQMVESKQNRNMLYHLAEDHEGCPFLEYALELIASKGHSNEIVAIESTATNFPLFAEVLHRHILNSTHLQEHDLNSKLEDFKKVCCYSQTAYLYTQVLLTRIIQNQTNPQIIYHFKRLSEELEQHARKSHEKHGKEIDRVKLLLLRANDYPDEMQTIIDVLTSKQISPATIKRLFDSYSNSNPPPIELLRIPEVLNGLVSQLFEPHNSIFGDELDRSLYILSYACCMTDARTAEEISDREETEKVLRDVQQVCQSNPQNQELVDSARLVKENLKFPVVSMGALHWIHHNMKDESSYSSAMSIYLELLREIIQQHPVQRIHVFNILKESLQKNLIPEGPTQTDKILVDHIIYVMIHGVVHPALQFFEVILKQFSPELIRYFLLQTLKAISPPYSQSFSSALTIILRNDKVFRSCQDYEIKEMIRTFSDSCNPPQTQNLNLYFSPKK
eukprot:c19571_g1_i1.p1 GENE.c19571_g1_i1~~c19571_g1_i1.p1  ORF type:complete len:498 (+),score=143.39 c19571_g1_i1:67-1560(+)